MSFIVDLSGLFVLGIVLALAILFLLGNMVYLVIREKLYDKRCPMCKNRHGCFRNKFQACQKYYNPEVK